MANHSSASDSNYDSQQYKHTHRHSSNTIFNYLPAFSYFLYFWISYSLLPNWLIPNKRKWWFKQGATDIQARCTAIVDATSPLNVLQQTKKFFFFKLTHFSTKWDWIKKFWTLHKALCVHIQTHIYIHIYISWPSYNTEANTKNKKGINKIQQMNYPTS